MRRSASPADETQWLLLGLEANDYHDNHDPPAYPKDDNDDDDDSHNGRRHRAAAHRSRPCSSSSLSDVVARQLKPHGQALDGHSSTVRSQKVVLPRNGRLFWLVLLSFVVLLLAYVTTCRQTLETISHAVAAKIEMARHMKQDDEETNKNDDDNDGNKSISVKDKLQTLATQSLQENLNNNIKRIPTKTIDQQPKQRHCETTVLLLRHCDDHGIFAKDDQESGDKHCSHMGYLRAEYLPILFQQRQWASTTTSSSSSSSSAASSVTLMYAQLPEQPQGTNFRQIETLLPLARQENQTIHVVREPDQVARAIFDRLQNNPNEMCGTVTVVAWKHAFLPQVAAHLGCGPQQGCPVEYPAETFDQVWQLKFVFAPQEPTQEVVDLYRAHSLLIQDDYGLLAQAVLEMDDKNAAAAGVAERYGKANEGDNGSGTSGVKWTVYGTVTHQFFDPLALERQAEYSESS